MPNLIIFDQELYVVPVKPMDHKGLDIYMGRYDEVDPLIEEMKYRRPPKSEIRLRIGLLQKAMTTVEIKRLGLWREKKKHVDLPELLLLGRYQLKLPFEGRLMAFRSLTVVRGKERAAAICRIQSERHLSVITPNKKGYWPANSHLLLEEL